MSEDITIELENHRKEYVMIQQRLASLRDEANNFSVAAERKMGIIQYLEAKIKKQKEPAVDVSS